MGWGDGLARRLFPGAMARARDAGVREGVRNAEEPGWRPLTAAGPALGEPWWSVRDTLERAVAACDSNPLAARLVQMTTEFVVGGGVRLEGAAWAQRFWRDPRNNLDQRVYRWCAELCRAGELFLVLSANPATGMQYVREVPASRIDAIDTDLDDAELELRYHQLTDDPEGRWWPSADLALQAPQVMLHYAINRPVGAIRGRSDLAPILPWLERYDMWLEDRVRINRYKGAYYWVVHVENALPGQIEAKRAQYSRIPRPGSLIVTDGHERWEAVQPHIEAGDVSADGRAIRMMIAAGAGVPLHYLAEGEGTNRATAREMGTATLRRFRHRQYVFAWMLEDLLRVAGRRAGQGEMEVEVILDEVVGPLEEAAQAEGGD